MLSPAHSPLQLSMLLFCSFLQNHFYIKYPTIPIFDTPTYVLNTVLACSMILGIIISVFILLNSVSAELSPKQHSTMIKLSQILHNQTTLIPWNNSPDPCSWAGVICKHVNNSSSVTELLLSKYGLNDSSFLPLVCQIQTLQVLDVSRNMLSSIPGDFVTSCGVLPGLKLVNFSSNRVFGFLPHFSSGFTALESLDMAYNLLSGSIVSQLIGLVSLKGLNLSFNNFIGSIPANVSSNLFRLRAGGNILNGTILPIKFDKLQKLQYLELEGNSLSGTIPSKLGSCQKLKLLNLARNNFSGELPTELGNLTQLTVLSLQFNNFRGSIPQEITQLTNLLTLNISWNSLSGSIPSNISALNNLAFLSGYIASVPRKLQYSLNLSHNLFEGPIPVSLQQLTSIEILDLSHNRFSGKIPDFLTHLGYITLLLLNNNNLSGERPNFPKNVVVDTNGNPGLIILSPESSPVSSHMKKLGAIKIAVGFGALFFGGLVAFLAVSISRRFFCSSKAMEVVANPLNLVLSTKFSSYYKVTIPSGRSYLVKKINCSDRIILPNGHESFGKELEALGKLNSSNIMIPLAYMLAQESAYLFYNLTYKGTLFDVLHRSSGIPLDWVSRCTIAVGLAQGLAFLHGCSSGPILLFDLSCKTIMLKSLKEPQIGDIELCKVIDPSKSTSSLSAVAGSVGYIPPEYAYTMKVTRAGNVYSFGVILLELVTGKQAVSEGTELAKWVWSNSTQPQKWDRILDYSVSRTSPAVKSQMLAVFKIALACIHASSEARPKMKSVLRMLLNVR